MDGRTLMKTFTAICCFITLMFVAVGLQAKLASGPESQVSSPGAPIHLLIRPVGPNNEQLRLSRRILISLPGERTNGFICLITIRESIYDSIRIGCVACGRDDVKAH